MSLAKREKVTFNNEDVNLVLKCPNNRRQITITGVTELTLAGNGKEDEHWYILIATTSRGQRKFERVLDVEDTGDPSASEVRKLFPRTKQGTTVAEEHAKGNRVSSSDVQR